jgi:ribosomal protein L31
MAMNIRCKIGNLKYFASFLHGKKLMVDTAGRIDKFKKKYEKKK